MERNCDRDGRIQQQRKPVVLVRGSSHVHCHPLSTHADKYRRAIYSDDGERNGRNFQLHNPGHGRHSYSHDADRNADCDCREREFFLDRHGEHSGDGASGTERQLYILSISNWRRDFQFSGKFWMHGLARVNQLRL